MVIKCKPETVPKLGAQSSWPQPSFPPPLPPPPPPPPPPLSRHHQFSRHRYQVLKAQGDVEVHPWNMNLEEGDLYYAGQFSSINDCLYRHLFTSRYLLFGDVDEMFVQRDSASLMDLLEEEFTQVHQYWSVGFGGWQCYCIAVWYYTASSSWEGCSDSVVGSSSSGCRSCNSVSTTTTTTTTTTTIIVIIIIISIHHNHHHFVITCLQWRFAFTYCKQNTKRLSNGAVHSLENMFNIFQYHFVSGRRCEDFKLLHTLNYDTFVSLGDTPCRLYPLPYVCKNHKNNSFTNNQGYLESVKKMTVIFLW